MGVTSCNDSVANLLSQTFSNLLQRRQTHNLDMGLSQRHVHSPQHADDTGRLPQAAAENVPPCALH